MDRHLVVRYKLSGLRHRHNLGPGEGIMGRIHILCTTAAAMFGMAGLCTTAHAIQRFTQMHKMKCEACHSVIPKLNEFGAAFLAKGFALPLQGERDKPDDGTLPGTELPQTPSTRKGDASQHIPTTGRGEGTPVAETAPETGSAGKPLSDVPSPPPPYVPPTIVYQVPSLDGSIHYTDNPVRKGGLLLDKEPEPGPSVAEKGWKPSAPAGKSIRRMYDSQPADGGQDADETSHPRYGSYRECMEEQLEDESLPDSAQDMMESFRAAEQKCAPYQRGADRHGRK